MMNYMDLLPNFLGIGAQKAGTTWLDANLRNHPDIYIPPKKEIHYFDRSPSYSSPSSLFSASPFYRIIGREEYNRSWRKELKECMKRNIGKFQWQQIRWDFKFYSGRYNDEWYASLFEQGRGRLKGEITPSYSILESKDIKHIYNLMPNAKIIYILRNPIDRDWSAVRYLAKKKGWSLENDSTVDFRRVLEWKSVLSRGDYVGTINNWNSYYPKQQMFVGFFEEIVQNPKQFLLKVFKFLEVDTTDKHVSSRTFEKFNESPHKDMPHELKLLLSKRHYSQIRILCEMFGGHTHAWLRDAEATISTAEGAGVL